jgi:hypothetical protein
MRKYSAFLKYHVYQIYLDIEYSCGVMTVGLYGSLEMVRYLLSIFET